MSGKSRTLLESVVDFLEDEPGDVESDIRVEVPCAADDLLDSRLPEIVPSGDKTSAGSESRTTSGFVI